MNSVVIHLLGGIKDGETLEVALQNNAAPRDLTYNTMRLGKNNEQIRETLLYQRTNEINARGEIIYKFEATE